MNLQNVANEWDELVDPIYGLKEMEEDGLVIISETTISITELGKDFAQFITNRFDVYDPPSKPYNQRLDVIKKAKDAQKKFLDYANNL